MYKITVFRKAPFFLYVLLISLLAVISAHSLSVENKKTSSDKQYYIQAKNVEYNEKTKIFTLTENVEIFRKDYTLKADKVIYNKVKNSE